MAEDILDDLKLQNLISSEAVDVAQNSLLWKLLAATGPVHFLWRQPEMTTMNTL